MNLRTLSGLGSLVALAACGLGGTEETLEFENTRSSLCNVLGAPGYTEFLANGRVEMTGQYLLEFNPATAQREFGQIEIAFDLNNRTTPRADTVESQLTSIEITNVIGILGAGLPKTRWTVDLSVALSGVGPTSGFVSATEPSGPEGDPPTIRIDANGAKFDVTSDDSETSRALSLVFLGTFLKEDVSGPRPLVACGTIDDNLIAGLNNGEFFLEEVR